MNQAALAQTLSGQNLSTSELPLSDPFASPLATPLQRPVPCVPAWIGSRGSRDPSVPCRRHDSLSPGSHQSSFSSTGVSSIDLEKAAFKDEMSSTPVPKVREMEKVTSKSPRRNNSSQERQSRTSPAASEVITMTYPEEDRHEWEGHELQESKALSILLFLSGPCVLLSILNTIWALMSLFITALTQPVRLCARRPSFATQLAGLIGPALNLHLRAIYTPLSPHANEDGSYHTVWLFLVHMLSPFLSFALMFLAWIVGAYWGVSQVVGDPAGMDKRDDGRDTVLGLRNWWESFLLKAVQADPCAVI